MSVVRCEYCDKNIDTDHNLEHFSEDGICMLELEKQEAKHPHDLIEKGKLYDELKASHEELMDTCDMAIGGLTALASLLDMNNPLEDNELIKLIKSRVSKARKL